MEGHAEMDMSVTEGGSLWQRMTSDRGLTAISHYFVMDWAAVWLDIVGGLAPYPLFAIPVGDGSVSEKLLPLVFGGAPQPAVSSLSLSDRQQRQTRITFNSSGQ